MPTLSKGRYVARLTENAAEIRAVQALRYRCFRESEGDGVDRDAYDEACRHVMIERRGSGAVVGGFRLMYLADGSRISDSYAAQHYDLSGLASYPHPMVELGRFCIAPGARNADILRIAWGALTRYVDARRIGMIFGCSTFQGIDGAAYLDAFAELRARHLAPECWRPRVKSRNVIRFAECQHHAPDLNHAMRVMPPLLRSYLAMGGWVSDHAVIDHDLGTLHVFTGLEVAQVSPARARALRQSGADRA